MRSTLVTVLGAIVTLTLSACVTKNSVLFVTKTSLGIDLDTKPANVSISYDRVEGYVGARYDSGAIPPVLTSISSNAKIFNPAIRQVYATGDAAYNIALENTSLGNTPKPLTGDKKLMFFGTTTTTGLKVGFTSNFPDSLLFGYKRKEFSFIPLGRHNDADVYPSVLASIDTGATAGLQKETTLRTKQFFATGSVAEALGTKGYIQEDFKEKARDAFAAYRQEVAAQNREALMVLRCFTFVAEADLPAVWADADRLGLFRHEDNLRGDLMDRYDTAIGLSRDDPNRSDELRKLRGRYAAQIGIPRGSSPTRAALIRAHRKHVCPGPHESTTP